MNRVVIVPSDEVKVIICSPRAVVEGLYSSELMKTVGCSSVR